MQKQKHFAKRNKKRDPSEWPSLLGQTPGPLFFKQAPGLLRLHSRALATPARSDGTKPDEIRSRANPARSDGTKPGIATKISVKVNNY